jgi:protein TonB
MKSIKLLFFTFLFSVSCFSQSEGESKGKENQDTKNVPFVIVESPPVYPGCIGTKKEKIKCLNVSMQQFLAKNFDFSLTNKLDLSAGKYRFLVMLVVKPSGYSEAVKVQAPHPDIVKELKRVVSTFPKMKPGNQRGKAIGMRYALPLTVIVQ